MKNKRITTFLVALATIGLFVCLVPLQAAADTHNFNQRYNTSWTYRDGGSGADNWSGSNYPSNGDTLIMDPQNKYSGTGNLTAYLGSEPTFTASAITIQGYSTYTSTFTLNNYTLATSNVLTLNAGGILNLSSSGTLNTPTLTLSGGTFTKSGGTLKVSTLFTQSSGTSSFDTLTIDGTANNVNAYTLSGGTMTVGTLNLNSTNKLNIGSNTITVSNDYNSTISGTGNSFNPYTGVTRTTGKINASNAGQQITGGTKLTGGTTSTATLNFGNVHVSPTAITENYQIKNSGTTTSIRGAIQTTANGALINDGRLGGAGVTAANFGPIAAAASSGSNAVTFTPTTAGALTGQKVYIINNFDNVTDQTLNITGAAYNLAAAGTITPNPIALANQHVGGSATQALTVTNTAAAGAYSEKLDATFGTLTGSVTTSGAPISLLAAQSSSTALALGLNTSTAGAKTGSAVINLTSNGTGTSGLANTALTAQTVNISGNVYNYAAANTINTPITLTNQRVGGTVTSALTVTNTAPAGSYTEKLDASFGTLTGSATTNGAPISLLAAQTSSTALALGVDTSTAGAKSGTAVINLTSDGTGTSGLANTALTAQTVSISGNVYNAAAANTLTTPITLASQRVGGTTTQALSVTNTSPAGSYTEKLDASFGTLTGDTTNNSGIINLLSAGSTDSASLRVGVNTATAGAKSGTAIVNFATNGSGTSGLGTLALASQTVTVTGKVYKPAEVLIGSTSINFGTVRVGETVAPKSLSVTNAATAAGLNDVLVGTFSGGSGPLSASGNLGTGLAPGANSGSSLQAQLSTATAGAFTGTATVNLASSNPDMADLPLGSTNIALTGTVNNYANPAFNLSGSTGTLSGGGNAYTLNLGTVTQGAGTISALLSLKNDAVTPADWLSGSYSYGASSAYQLAGFDPFSNLGAGSEQTGLSVMLSKLAAGDFTYVITLNALSGNDSSVVGLTPVLLNVLGTVAPVPIPPTVWLLGAGLLSLVGIRRFRK
jgi:hypothetical protein